MDMNIQKYIAFLKTVELKSFTKAAEALNYSQSGISRMINDLEDEWGVTLLERNRTLEKVPILITPNLMPFSSSSFLCIDSYSSNKFFTYG